MKSFVEFFLAQKDTSRNEHKLMREEGLTRDEIRCAASCAEPSEFLQWLNREGRHEIAA